jgi:putative MATE family efflux protein
MSESTTEATDRADSSPVTLGTAAIPRLLMQYSVPAIIASVATSLYNIVDSIFIGQGVGAMAITGLAITFPLMNLLVAFATLISAGGATICSIFLGQKDVDRATAVVNNVLLFCLIHAAIFGSVTFIWLDDILRLFGATDATLPYARSFMRVIVCFTPVNYVFFGLNNIMRATGYPRKAMVSALLSVGVNLVLAPIFIFVFRWGIAGAAWATAIGQSSGLVWVLCHFLSPRSFVHIQWRNRWVVPSLLRRIYAIGLSPFLMNICACIVVIFINKSLLFYGGDAGNMAVGAFGILNRTTMFFVMVVFGVTQGMQPILGYNYGAGNWPRVKQTLRIGLLVGFCITTAGFLITELFPDQVSRMFTTDAELIAIARRAYRLYFVVYPVVGCQIVIQNFFQSIGKPHLSIFLSLTRQLLFLIPCLLILPPVLKVDGVWLAMAASDLLAILTAVVTLCVMLRRINKRFYATATSIESAA